MRKKETDKALEIASQIQELIYYIIPEKWKNIELYVSMPDSRIRKGELFFYYLPNSIFKRQYINCYEVPYMFNISEKEYSDIMSKLYNKFMILKEELNKNNRQVEEIYVHITKEKYVYEIATDNVRLRKENIENNMLNLFTSYENHIIWRYLNLGIFPDDRKEKEIIGRYLDTNIADLLNEEIEFDIIEENIKSIVDFEKILTVEEAIARSIYENKNKNKNKKYNDKENDDSLNLEELMDKDRNIEKGKEKTKKNIFKNLIEKINSEKEVFLDINKQDEDLEDYIMEGNSGLWDEEEHTNWVDDIDSLEEEENKEETEEKGLFD
jgi:hypothetical protein